MSHRTLPLPPCQAHRIIPAQDASFHCNLSVFVLKYIPSNLMLRHQEHLARITAQVIRLDGLTEGQGLGILLSAKDHHVGEVAAFRRERGGIWGCVLAEDAAGGEGGFYGPHNEARRGE
jgi:hypothetical protein